MEQILVYSDSLSWGIVPLTRNRLPFDARWPGVMEKPPERGGRAGARNRGLPERQVHGLGGSRVDGVHLDADQHLALGEAMARAVRPLLAR